MLPPSGGPQEAENDDHHPSSGPVPDVSQTPDQANAAHLPVMTETRRVEQETPVLGPQITVGQNPANSW